jgi:aspartate aminotransferase
MTLSSRTKSITPSVTLALSAKAKKLKAQGVDVINLTAGEPDFDTPEPAKDAARLAIQEGFTKYTPISGIDELKSAIVEKFRRDNGLDYQKSEIIVSCGAKHSLYNISQALFESGDEVIIPAPYWVTYPDQIRLCGARPVFVQTDEKDHFAVRPETVRSAVTQRTKAIILNSPGNPTGSAYDRPVLERIAEIALERGLYVISDEIYEPFVYDGFRHESIACVSPEIKKRTLLVNGVSKAFAMTGWRIGYTAGPREIVEAMDTLQSQSTSNPDSIAQRAAVAALREGRSFTEKMVSEFDKRRRLVVDRLNRLPGISCTLPRGAFYVFPNVGGILSGKYKGRPLDNAGGVAEFLLEECRVVVVPGEAFGGPGHLRISYAVSLEDLTKALDRIEAGLKTLG